MRNLSLYLLAVLLMSGCSQIERVDFDKTEETKPPFATQTRSDGGNGTFDSLPDPYALENMQAVYDQYDGNTTLQPTDLYVRIMPQDSTQIEMLEDLYDLDLFDYPLDFDIPAGEEYVDPTIPEGEFGWYYTTVKPDFVFPEGVVYEIIRECYIPEDNEVIELPGTRAGEGEIDVEKAALERLGYSTGVETRSGGGGGQRPEGYVMVRDDSDTYVPVAGIRVKVHSHTKIDKEVYTNASGFYRTNKKFWQENLKYTLVFLNKQHDFIFWVVKHKSSFGRAKYEDKITKWGGPIYIERGDGEQWQWAAMYNAACEYYQMCSTTGITKPPHDLKILYCPDYLATLFNGSCSLMARRMYLGIGEGSLRRLFKDLVKNLAPKKYVWLADIVATIFETNGPDLLISTYSSGSVRSYRDIYNTMNHELSHASHFSKVGVGYWEKYVRYIANSLLSSEGNIVYGDGTGQYAGNCAVGEMWGYAMGEIRECEKYNTGRLSFPYFNTPPDIDPFRRAGEEIVEGDGGWIRPDPIWALITRGVLTKKEIFDCLTSDVDTVDKLISKMCTKYPAKAQTIRIAFSLNDVINFSISGPTAPPLNTTATYTVLPAPLPAGVTFDRFVVFGIGYTVVSQDTTARVLRLKFTSNANPLTIAARFTLPGNVPHQATLTIPANERPADFTISGPGGAVGGMKVTFSVDNPQPRARFEWQVDNIPKLTLGDDRSITTTAPTRRDIYEMVVKCRASLNGYTTEWVYALVTVIPPRPIPPGTVPPGVKPPAEIDWP